MKERLRIQRGRWRFELRCRTASGCQKGGRMGDRETRVAASSLSAFPARPKGCRYGRHPNVGGLAGEGGTLIATIPSMRPPVRCVHNDSNVILTCNVIRRRNLNAV